MPEYFNNANRDWWVGPIWHSSYMLRRRRSRQAEAVDVGGWSAFTTSYQALSGGMHQATGGLSRDKLVHSKYWLNEGDSRYGTEPSIETLIWVTLHELEAQLKLMPCTAEYREYWNGAVELAMGICPLLAEQKRAMDHLRLVESDAAVLGVGVSDPVTELARNEFERCNTAVREAGKAIVEAISARSMAVVAVRRREQAEAAALRRAEIAGLEAAGMDSRPDGLRQVDELVDRARSTAMEAAGVAEANNVQADLCERSEGDVELLELDAPG
jgi:hypothetical protein